MGVSGLLCAFCPVHARKHSDLACKVSGTASAAAPAPSGVSTVQVLGQCGGTGDACKMNGDCADHPCSKFQCIAGSKCVRLSEWVHQCQMDNGGQCHMVNGKCSSMDLNEPCNQQWDCEAHLICENWTSLRKCRVRAFADCTGPDQCRNGLQCGQELLQLDRRLFISANLNNDQNTHQNRLITAS